MSEELSSHVKENRSFLDSSLKVLSVFTAVAWVPFVCGWLYLFAIYDSFGVDITMLDLPIYYPVIASVMPLSRLIRLLPWLIVPSILVVALWIFEEKLNDWIIPRLSSVSFLHKQPTQPTLHKPTSSYYYRYQRVARWVLKLLWVFPPVYIFLFALLVAIGQGARLGREWHENPPTTINLVFKKDEDKLFDPAMVKANSDGTLMRLAETKDTLFMFVTDEHGHAKPGVFTVPRSNLLSVFTTSNSGSHTPRR